MTPEEVAKELVKGLELYPAFAKAGSGPLSNPQYRHGFFETFRRMAEYGHIAYWQPISGPIAASGKIFEPELLRALSETWDAWCEAWGACLSSKQK